MRTAEATEGVAEVDPFRPRSDHRAGTVGRLPPKAELLRFSCNFLAVRIVAGTNAIKGLRAQSIRTGTTGSHITLFSADRSAEYRQRMLRMPPAGFCSQVRTKRFFCLFLRIHDVVAPCRMDGLLLCSKYWGKAL
jgi:hypothetical protein